MLLALFPAARGMTRRGYSDFTKSEMIGRFTVDAN